MVTGSFLLAGTALAAPPANDDFANAIVLSGNSGIQTGTNNIDATFQTGEPVPATSATKTVWFKWTCPADGAFTVDTLGSMDLAAGEWDSVLGIFSGAAVTSLTPLGTTPLEGGTSETMTIPVTAGTTYFVQLAGSKNGAGEVASNNIKLTWSFAATVYDANIVTFGPGAVVGAVSGNAATITQTLPYGTNLATYAPTFTLSPGATCNRTSGAVPTPNFGSGPVVYTVTSQGASPTVNNYTVNVTKVAEGLDWNLAAGGDWDFSTTNWLKQPAAIVSNFTNGDGVAFSNPAGGVISIPAAVAPGSTVVNAPSGTYTFSGGPVAGTGSITKSNGGTLNLIGVNTYSGSTMIEGGTLVATGTAALGYSPSYNLATGATLTLKGMTETAKKWPQDLITPAGSNLATLTGGGTLNVDAGEVKNCGLNFNMSSFTGNVNISGGAGGAVAVNSVYSPGFTAPITGSMTVANGATLYLGWTNNTFTTNVKLNTTLGNNEGYGALRGDTATLNGTVTLNTNSTLGCAGGTFTVNSVISDGGGGYGFTTVQSGTVVLGATTNTYTGPTIVSAPSKMQCNAPGALGSGPLSVLGNLDLNYSGTRTVSSLTLGGVAKTAAGTYGSTASGATFKDDTFFKPGSLGTVTVSGAVVSNYDTWLTGFTFPSGADKTPTGDPDGDGMTNQKEYAFGLNPTLGTSVNPITQMLDKTTGNFQYTRRANPVDTGLTYTVFTSTDLVTWTAGGSTQTGVATAGNVETVTVNVTTPAVGGKLFVRVEAKPAP